MVFSSHIFVFYFLLLSVGLYYAVPRRMKHLLLTLVSYVFYGWWNPWFVFLMLFSTAIDYWCGKIISAEGASRKRRKTGMMLSVVSNLALLFFFKYATFAAGSVSGLADLLGWQQVALPSFFYHIVLPVGISFYTFQSMSYCIDLYRGHAEPSDSFIDFACYVSMFPQLVAGPIVRYGHVAEQLRSRVHTLEDFTYGIIRFQLGFAKKILLANPMGLVADICFQSGEGSLGVVAAWLGVCAYAFQIYFDFSAYSDMAIGLGRMFAFRFPENFDSPYKAVNITDFWRRWHISLSTFLRDYLYIPLGGNRHGSARTYVNLMTVMLLGGLWHGAQWNFLVWGAIHGGMLSFERLMGKDSIYGRLPGAVRIALTFAVVLITWVFFRAENLEVALRYLKAMFGFGGGNQAEAILTAQVLSPANLFYFLVCAAAVWCFPRTFGILRAVTLKKALLALGLFILALAVMFSQGFNPFLYFQF